MSDAFSALASLVRVDVSRKTRARRHKLTVSRVTQSRSVSREFQKNNAGEHLKRRLIERFHCGSTVTNSNNINWVTSVSKNDEGEYCDLQQGAVLRNPVDELAAERTKARGPRERQCSRDGRRIPFDVSQIEKERGRTQPN